MLAADRPDPPDDLPADFGWVLNDYMRRVRVLDQAMRRRDAAEGLQREFAQLDVDAAKAGLDEFRREIARGWLYGLRAASEHNPEAIGPLLGEAAARGAEPFLEGYRERLFAAERRVGVLEAQVADLLAAVAELKLR